ncbi:MAG: Glu-tRNA(Gln) amidotransferase subunit GatE [Methanomassiliicoccales archaeon]|nr:MAG: Glu-tRNA(Gln) amidotransferase subunit GatE [Methanomassiliicoccales archaeon]
MAERVTVGIEIHQQLDTNKLFCSCPSELVEEEGATIYRRLRPSQSEMGEVDRAALAQAARRMSFRYQCPSSRCCLVEADEEPPHDADGDALRTTLTVAEMTGCKVIDEVHFMRKIVIDGSNTSGFQRTALVAIDGHIEVGGKKVRIQSICLEEDAARKVETKGSEVTYRLDRLGIPLIEIATGPDMHDPEEVKDVAVRIGSILRATKMVKRGLGTIREDLNISIPGGARVEIKGAQELKLLPIYVEKEIERQSSLLKIRDELKARGVRKVAIELVDCTEVLKGCRSKVISSALAKGGKVYGVALPGFEGLLKSSDGKLRLGSEMAQYAKTKGVAGIFHTDELPGYGILQEEVDALRSHLGLPKGCAFAICADEEAKASSALKLAAERAYMALDGVPEETRDPLPDGTSAYSRPLPGAGRMYPETDVRPIPVPREMLDSIRASLPELPEAKIRRFVERYGIHEQQSRQIVREGNEELFEDLASRYGMASVAARMLLNIFPEMEKEGLDPSKVSEGDIDILFKALYEGRFTKEALPDMLKKVAGGIKAEEAVKELSSKALSISDIEAAIDRIILERAAFVNEKGMGAVGPLMSFVMAELRGKVDGRQANELLRRRIELFLSKEKA